jgi:hypothetical protein
MKATPHVFMLILQNHSKEKTENVSSPLSSLYQAFTTTSPKLTPYLQVTCHTIQPHGTTFPKLTSTSSGYLPHHQVPWQHISKASTKSSGHVPHYPPHGTISPKLTPHLQVTCHTIHPMVPHLHSRQYFFSDYVPHHLVP